MTNTIVPPPIQPHIICDVYEGVWEPYHGTTPLIGLGHKLRASYQLNYEPNIAYEDFIPPPVPDIELIDAQSHEWDSTL